MTSPPVRTPQVVKRMIAPRLFNLVLLMLVLAIGIYIGWAIQRERGARRKVSLSQDVALARIGAHLIDERCERIRIGLRVLLQRERRAFTASGTLRIADRDDFEQDLHDAFTMIPKPAALEIVGPNGHSTYFDSLNDRSRSGQDDIRRAVMEIRSSRGRIPYRWSRRGNGAILLAMSAEEAGQGLHVMLASYRSQVLDDWLQAVSATSDNVLYVLDERHQTMFARGRGSDSSVDDRWESRSSFLANSGSFETYGGSHGEPMLAGYSVAAVPKWTVVAAEPIGLGLDSVGPFSCLLAATAVPLMLVALALTWLAGSRGDGEAREATPAHPRSSNDDLVPPPLAPGVPSTQPVFVRGGTWKVVSASVRGSSHLKTDTPCQDASACEVLENDVLVAAVADGAGSAACGDRGAQVAARLAVATLAAHAWQMTRSNSDEQWSRLLLAAMDVARGHVEMTAAAGNRPSRQFATTLILFAAMPDLIVAAQIGDGAVVFRDSQGIMQPLTRPQSGEYVNTTTFLVSPGAFKSVQQKVWRGSHRGIAAFTDGLQMLALTMPQARPHAPFFHPLFEFMEAEASGEQVTTELTGFLSSDKIAQRTDDDLTLMLATVTS